LIEFAPTLNSDVRRLRWPRLNGVPFGLDRNTAELLPTPVCTPDGKEYELRSDELREELSSRYGSDVELMNIKHGIFDESPISVISLGTVHGVERESGGDVDLRRFRPNVVIETNSAEPFEEDRWVGRTLMFGEGTAGQPRWLPSGLR
jgi:hypothetical protein